MKEISKSELEIMQFLWKNGEKCGRIHYILLSR